MDILLQQEKTILEVTETICGLMTQLGVSRKRLAELLNVDTKRVSAILNGSEDVTLRTVSDIFSVLGVEMKCSWRQL